MIIKFIVAAAFYPNYYVTTPTSQYDAIKILNAKDPKCTVAVRPFIVTCSHFIHLSIK